MIWASEMGQCADVHPRHAGTNKLNQKMSNERSIVAKEMYVDSEL